MGARWEQANVKRETERHSSLQLGPGSICLTRNYKNIARKCAQNTSMAAREEAAVGAHARPRTLLPERRLGMSACAHACTGVLKSHTNAEKHTRLQLSQRNRRSHVNPQMCKETGGRWGRRDWVEEWSAWKEGGGVWWREGVCWGRPGVYYCLKGSGCCVQINKQEVIVEGLYIYFLS